MIDKNINDIKQKIYNICKCRENEYLKNVTLVAVTKKVPIEDIKTALSFGISEIGENRIQEAENKFTLLSEQLLGVKKNFIGHLQTNKVKKAVQLFDLIQSVDSWYLASEINKCAEKISKIQQCLIEVKVSEEESKYGVLPQNTIDLLNKISSLKNIKVIGLMAMAPYFEDIEKSRPYFREVKNIYDKIRSIEKYSYINVLSMGMSNDFEIALQEGATMIRIGSALFNKHEK